MPDVSQRYSAQVSHSLHLGPTALVRWLYVPEQIYAAIWTEHSRAALIFLPLYEAKAQCFIHRSMESREYR